jgi:ribose/xylose/arabinose/galactoside ABC-type transport system permease subunit
MSEAVLRRKRPEDANFGYIVERHGLLIFCAVLTVGALIFAPNFGSAANLRNVLISASPLGVVVLGQCLVILVRGFDLSVASVMATAAVIAASFDADNPWSVIPAVLLSLLMAVVVGSINGFLVTRRKVSPFLATLGVMIMLQGLRFAWTKGAPLGLVTKFIRVVGTGTFHGVPINFVFLLVLALIVAFVLRRTTFGRRVYMVGGNPRAAELVGINVDRVIFSCYVLSSVLAAIGGLVLVGYVNAVDNWVGRGYELDSIVAAVMGGVALGGGRGTVLGALIGALVLTELFNIVLLLGLPVQVQLIVKGVVILVAVAVYLIAQKTR